MSSAFLTRNNSDTGSSIKSNGTLVMNKAKQWQMELLMEKLRSKSGQYKTFTESAKMLRMALLEKRYPVDGVERIQLQKCLDTLQNSIRVTTLNGMVERLESVSRQLGLKFMAGGAGLEWFISSDMFYVEVVLESSGDVKDVKIHHEKRDQQSCEELVNCLQQRDFVDFAAQLEGLTSIYQLNAEKAAKCKALSALQSLEADLTTLASLQTLDAQSMLFKSPVGILQKRRGGHAMRLTYWVSPYDLLDQKTMTAVAMTVEEVNKRNIGYSVTVCMEGSTSHKLQVLPLITTQRSPNGNNVPVYSSLQQQNSASLPACFALKLKEPLPLCVTLAQRIHRVTDMECGDLSSPHPLLSLITQHTSRGQLDCANNNGLYVTLPDQLHCYRMTENKGLEAVMVSNVPFSHPKQVPYILGVLRQQAIFNTLISSCIRTNSKTDIDATLLEVTALSWQDLSISLEHPLEESMATLELDLSDPSNIKCNLFGAGSTAGKSAVTPEFVSKVVQRCMSIPVTMRSLIKAWQSQSVRTNGFSNGNGNFNMPLGSGGGGDGYNDDGSRHGMSDFNNLRDPHIKMEPHDSNCNDMADSAGGFPSFNSPLLGEIAGASQINYLAGTSMIGHSKDPVVINLMSDSLMKKKQRKRKAMENMWRNPKFKSEDCEILVDSSSNDSTPQGTPTSREAPMDFRIPTPTSVEFSQLTEDGKLDSALADKMHAELEAMNAEDVMEIQDIDSVEEMLKAVSARKPKKPREERKSPSSIMLDLEGKNMVPPSVSITPIHSSSPSSLSSNLNSVLSGMGLERRPGIEIIPIGSTPPATLPSTITITPIPSSKAMSDDRSRDRKSREKSRSEEEERRLEKKRKRKREDSPMGPPDKLPPKQDPLSKPVSVSIKPTDSPPVPMSRPSSPAGTLRKYSTSPTHTSPLALMSKSASSPGGLSKSSKPPSTQQSPKHSPAYSTSSPKHNPIPSSVSPKHHGTSSPKHTAGSSGKPSMSTLKSAASSPSSKSSSGDSMKVKPPSSSTSSNKDSSSNRDKDRSRISSSMSSSTSSSSGSTSNTGSSSSTASGGSSSSSGMSSSGSGHQSPKPKTASIKLKQLDLSLGSDTTVIPIPPQSMSQSGSSTPPSTTCSETKTLSGLPQIRNRKNSLSAVIDKLKSQHTGEDLIGSVGGSSSGGISSGSSNSNPSISVSIEPGSNVSRDRIPTPTKGTDVKVPSTSGKPGDLAKNPEYMVKPSSEGIKLTINKTRTKESSSKSSSSSSSSAGIAASSSSSMTKSSSQSGSGSPKIHSGHTGLKPGVNSGPASKKPQTSTPLSSSSSSSSSTATSASLSKLLSGSSSSGSVSSSSTTTPGSSSSGSKLSSSNLSSSKGTSSSVSSSSVSSSTAPKSSSSSSSSSASKSVSKSSGSPKLGSSSSSSSSNPNRSRDDKPRPSKSSSSSGSAEKSLFSNSKGESRKSSPAPLREEDSERGFKAIPSKIDTPPPPFGLEGLVKSLDTKFQIPKLSARSNNPDVEQSKKMTDKPENVSGSRNVDSGKALDLAKPEAKYGSSSPVSSSSALQSTSSLPGLNLSSTKSDEKSNIGLIDTKVAKVPSSSVAPSHLSPSPRLTPSPLPKLESKTPTDGSPIPGLTITPVGSIASLGGGGGSSSNDSLDLSIDLSSRSSDSKSRSEPQRPASTSKEEPSMAKPFGSLSRAESPILKGERPRDFSLGGEEVKKLSLESALIRMEEARSTPPSGPSSQEAAEMLLDFSSAGKGASEPSVKKMSVTERVLAAMPSRRNTPPPHMFPASPSVTMHIVKSPSPLIIPSPQSGSPCITDDDLMDEALVGMGK